MSPQAVGIIISNSLMPAFVEKKDIGVPKIGTFVYRRHPVFSEPQLPELRPHPMIMMRGVPTPCNS
jgi:hypothetical protein